MDIGIDELANDIDIILIETWEHDVEGIECLGKYNVHSLIWDQFFKSTKRTRKINNFLLRYD